MASIAGRGVLAQSRYRENDDVVINQDSSRFDILGRVRGDGSHAQDTISRSAQQGCDQFDSQGHSRSLERAASSFGSLRP